MMLNSTEKSFSKSCNEPNGKLTLRSGTLIFNKSSEKLLNNFGYFNNKSNLLFFNKSKTSIKLSCVEQNTFKKMLKIVLKGW